MTFKHVKFEDSATMRSLEKIALQHGLIKPEPMTKTASVEAPDYTPSENLMENVIKLCAGLREAGFEKHANELEGKFIHYKRAFNAYETSKEKGEDLIDAAHPDGSHDLVGVEGDATIETILDQHLKNLKIVEKKPTGKLASTNAIIGAVRTVLAQDASVMKKHLDALKGSVAAISRIYHSENILGRPMSFAGGDLLEIVNSVDEKTLDLNKAKEIKVSLADVKNVYKPGFAGFGGVAGDAWEKMVPYFTSAEVAINKIIGEFEHPTAKQAPIEDPISNFNKQVNAALTSIDQTAAAIQNNPPAAATPQGIASANKWLENKKAKVIAVKQKLDSSPDKSPENAAFYSRLLLDIINKPGDSLADFRNVWA